MMLFTCVKILLGVISLTRKLNITHASSHATDDSSILYRYWKLFSASFYLSTFTFGGGFVIVPLLKKKFVDELGWIDDDEMMDLAAISQSAPGSMSVNAAILVGFKVQGFPGALMSVLGTALPPLLILTLVSQFYTAFSSSPVVAAVLHGMQAGVGAIIVDVVLSMSRTLFEDKVSFIDILIMMGSFIAVATFHVSAMWIILISIIFSIIRYTVRVGVSR